MYPRTNYEMTEADLETILNACKPVPVIMIGSYAPSTPQENANRAWAALSAKMGFDYETVQPREGMGMRHFSAVPSESEAQRAARLANEAEVARTLEIATLKGQQETIAARLAELNA